MSRTTFLSFHPRDVQPFRVDVVRHSRVFAAPGEGCHVLDDVQWEAAQARGGNAVNDLLDHALLGTDATAVLTGTSTHDRREVKYALVRSFVAGNALLCLELNQVREDDVPFIAATGLNPFSRLAVYVASDYQTLTFLEWVNGEWHPFAALPNAANQRSNAVYFKKSFFAKIGLGPSESKRRILFADLFATHRWQPADGDVHLAGWLATARSKRVHMV